MATWSERARANRNVTFESSTNSNPIKIAGYREFFLLINSGLTGQTINIQSLGRDGTWYDVLDAAGALVSVPTTTSGWVLLPSLPSFGSIRFVAGGSLDVDSELDAKS